MRDEAGHQYTGTLRQQDMAERLGPFEQDTRRVQDVQDELELKLERMRVDAAASRRTKESDAVKKRNEWTLTVPSNTETKNLKVK